MSTQNKKLLEIGRNIFKQIESNKSRNIIVSAKDMRYLFEYIFWLEKEYDKLKENKKEENIENVES